ncbi:hypothetical protein DFAR_1110015 [Desulfarculales bacterium]
MIEARCPHPNVVVWLCQKLTIPRPREGKAMVRVASLFSQLRHHFPRTEFAALVKEHSAAVRTKGLPGWTQFVTMLFCHLVRANFLREICQRQSSLLPGQAVPPWGERSPKKGPHCPTPTSTSPRPYSEPCSSKPWSASVPKAPWTGKRASSNSRTSFCAWTPPPLPCA